jgi:hypothetical protein
MFEHFTNMEFLILEFIAMFILLGFILLLDEQIKRFKERK